MSYSEAKLILSALEKLKWGIIEEPVDIGPIQISNLRRL